MSEANRPKLKKGSYLQYIKGDKMNEIVTVTAIHPLSEVPWLDSPLADLSDGESMIIDAILPGDTEDPFKDNEKYLIQVSSPDNAWVFEDVSPRYTEDNNTPSIRRVDDKGQTQEIPNPNYVPYEKRRYEYAVVSTPERDFNEDMQRLKEIQKKQEDIRADIEDKGNAVLSAIADTIADIKETKEEEYPPKEYLLDTGWGTKDDIRQIDLGVLTVIRPILDNCKVKDKELTFSVTATLPDASVMNLIKEQFGEEYKDGALDYILSKIDTDILMESLRSSLDKEYFGENSVSYTKDDIEHE